MAQIAVHTYDLDEIADRLARGADYDGLTAILAAELLPAKLHGSAREDGNRSGNPVRQVLTPAPLVPLTARLLPLVPAVAPAIEAGAQRPAIGPGRAEDDGEVSGSDRSPGIGHPAADTTVGRAVPEVSGPHRPVFMVPDRAVPDTTGPVRAVPDCAVPDTAVPVRAVPEQTLPDAVGLNRALPDAMAPDVVLSGGRTNADGGRAAEVGRRIPQARRAPDVAPAVVTGPIEPEQMTEEEKRHDARKVYQASVDAGTPLKGAELARIYGQKDPKWGTRRINDVRRGVGQATAGGEFQGVHVADGVGASNVDDYLPGV